MTHSFLNHNKYPRLWARPTRNASSMCNGMQTGPRQICGDRGGQPRKGRPGALTPPPPPPPPPRARTRPPGATRRTARSAAGGCRHSSHSRSSLPPNPPGLGSHAPGRRERRPASARPADEARGEKGPRGGGHAGVGRVARPLARSLSLAGLRRRPGAWRALRVVSAASRPIVARLWL